METDDERIKRQKYLLKNYLGGEEKEKKKKVKSNQNSSKNSRRKRDTIIDEDMDGFLDIDDQEDDDPVIIPPTQQKVPKIFKNKKDSGWKTVQGEDLESENEVDTNKIDKDEQDEGGIEQRMTNGARVGLQSGKQVAADIRRQEIMIKKKLMQLKPEEIGRDAETIYRDAKGKKIDMELENARLQAERQEEEMIEKARTERNKGMVQQELAQRRKEEFLRNKDGPMARYADDDEINNELKQKELWNDPAAKFLTKKKSKLRYPQYQGRAPPNRYNIPPGYRWDGRDRSNGFETKLFEKFNAQKYKLQEAHAWSTEDM